MFYFLENFESNFHTYKDSDVGAPIVCVYMLFKNDLLTVIQDEETVLRAFDQFLDYIISYNYIVKSN